MRHFSIAVASLALVATSASAQDFVLNGGFDTSLIGWEISDPNLLAEWLPVDADGDPDSGALRMTNVSAGSSNGVTVRQCIPVNAGQRYTTTGKVRIPDGDGQDLANLARIGIRWFSAPDCTEPNGGALSANGSPPAFNTWVNQTLSALARPGARSAEVRALVTKNPAGGTFIADFDDITLTSPSLFANNFD
jgi:hypothetical protein